MGKKKIIVVSNPRPPHEVFGGRSIEVYSNIEGEIEVEVFWPRKDDPKNEQGDITRRINGEIGMRHLHTDTSVR